MPEEKKDLLHSHASIDELNKTQVLLLTLFVAFVTSIASAIVTVTLLDQAPPAITQTINRVVERTVEVAVPGKAVTERVREVPVVVTEEDLIAEAVRTALPSVVFIMEASDTLVPVSVPEIMSSTTTASSDASSTPDLPPLPQVGNKVLGMGFIVSADGLVVTSADLSLSPKMSYVLRQVVRDKPKQWQAQFEYSDKKGFQLLRIGDVKTTDKLPHLSFIDGAPTLGKTAFAIGSRANVASIAIGAVSSYEDSTPVSSPKVLTSVAVGRESTGAPLLDTKGHVIGIVGRDGGTSGVAPIIEYLASKTTPVKK